MDTEIHFRAALETDIPAVRALLGACGLPADGIETAIANALLAEHDGVLVGSVAVEAIGPVGLLRSLAVAAKHRGQNVGMALCAAAIANARSLGIHGLFLLTTSADGFFVKHGFALVRREDVPAVLREHVQFRSACPASARCLHLVLDTLSNSGGCACHDRD